MRKSLIFNDYANTPGEIINDLWKFPTVISQHNKTGKERQWMIFIGTNRGMNKEWFINDSAIPPDIEVRTFTISGQIDGKMHQSAPTVIKTGKVKRNIIQQAISEAYSTWRKQGENGKVPGFIRPQLLKTMSEDLTGELFIQFKYDGVRAMAKLIDGEIKIYSRTCVGYNMPQLVEYLQPIFAVYPNITLDGEIYYHGLKLQIITSLVGTQDQNKLSDIQKMIKDDLYYYIFDAVDDLEEHYIGRRNTLNDIFAKLSLDSHLVNVPTFGPLLALTVADGRRLMKIFNNNDIEGLIIRHGRRGYKESINNYHSENVLKLKPCYSDEFIITGFDCGTGKNTNAIQWICEIPEGLEGLTAGKSFSVVPAITYEERTELYMRLIGDISLFNSDYRGKMLTVEYDEVSADGIPLRIRAVGIRFD